MILDNLLSSLHFPWLRSKLYKLVLTLKRMCHLEAVGFPGHDHRDGFAETSRGVQLVEAEHFADAGVHSTLRHEPETSLKYLNNYVIRILLKYF